MQESNAPTTNVQANLAEPESKSAQKTMDISLEGPGSLAQLPASSTEEAEWQHVLERATSILSDLPDFLTGFFGEYKRSILTISLIVGAVVAVKVTLAILNAINDVPLLAPTFELIGIGYSGWFIYRYLLRATNRKELVGEIADLKGQIVGKDS
jgi:hypothetical protein